MAANLRMQAKTSKKKSESVDLPLEIYEVITINQDDGLLDRVLKKLNTQSLVRAKTFRIQMSLLEDPEKFAKILEIFKIIEELDKYYGLELVVTNVIPRNAKTKAFFRALASKNCKIKALTTNLILTDEAAPLFKDFLASNTSITNLSLNLAPNSAAPQEIALQTIKALSSLKQNKTVRRLKLTGIDDDYSALSEILQENHSITSIDIKGRSIFAIEDSILPALAKMGSLKSIKFESVAVMPSVRSLREAIKCNKNLEKLMLFDRGDGFEENDPHLELLAETIAAHPSLQKLFLPGTSICPLLKTISRSNTIRTLEMPLQQLTQDMELQELLLSMKSLRKLVLLRREYTEARGGFPEMDLSNLVNPYSPIRKLVFDTGLRFLPTKNFIDILARNTSVQQIKFKGSFYYWAYFSSASTTNPLLQVTYNSTAVADQTMLTDYRGERKMLMTNFRKVIHCLTVLRTIYVAADRGVFATIPNEILLTIWSFVFYQPSQPFSPQSVTFCEHQLRKLIQIASDRSKLGNEPRTRKRLKSLWIVDDLYNICLSNFVSTK